MTKITNHITSSSEKFLAKYLNTASPTGFESTGQKVWLDYIKPYIDEHIVDTYGTVVGVINPEAKYKVVIEAHADEISSCRSVTKFSGLPDGFCPYLDPKENLRSVQKGGNLHS